MTSQTLTGQTRHLSAPPLAGPEPPAVRVVMLGNHPIARQLPDGWRVLTISEVREIREGDVVILHSPAVALVRWLWSSFRSVSVLALLPRTATSAEVIALLDAGAEVCLRDAGSVEVHAHLVAVRRRRGSEGSPDPQEAASKVTDPSQVNSA